jgi:hypothetical protein
MKTLISRIFTKGAATAELEREVQRLKDRLNDERIEHGDQVSRAQKLMEEVDKRDATVAKLERLVAQAQVAARFKAKLRPMSDAQMADGFKSMDEDSPQWKAVLSFLDQQLAIERDAVCQRSLSNEAAQYNRGRLAMLEDLRDGLVQAWAQQRVAA